MTHSLSLPLIRLFSELFGMNICTGVTSGVWLAHSGSALWIYTLEELGFCAFPDYFANISVTLIAASINLCRFYCTDYRGLDGFSD